MKGKFWFVLFTATAMFGMLLSACAPAAVTPAATVPVENVPATSAPAATLPEATMPAATAPVEATPAETGQATAAATTASTGAFTPMNVSAPDCNYGTADAPAKLKSIEAVDQYTVKFTLCAPDPAFPSKVAFSAFVSQQGFPG